MSRSPNCRGDNEGSATSSHVTGIATGAPGSARTAYGATIVCPYVLRATSTSGEQDPFDSDWYWGSWLVLAGAAFLAGYARPALAAVWGWLVVVPFAVILALAGTVFHDPDHGASMWMAGEVFVFAQAGFAAFASRMGGRAGTPVERV